MGGAPGLQLLAALLHEGDVAHYRKLGLSGCHFSGPESVLYSFVNSYVQKYNLLPEVEAALEQFPSLPKPTEPVKVYVDRVLARHKHRTLNKALVECNELMKKQDADAALNVVAKAVSELQRDPHYTGQKPLGQVTVSAPELISKEFPDRQMIVDPFLPAASLSLVYAMTGVGKTWFSLWLAICVASGEPFFQWGVPKGRRVLYVDGEMPTQDIQDRLFTLCPKPPGSLVFLPSESLWCDGMPLNLNEPGQQARLDEYLAGLTVEQKPDFIILDNLSSLSAGIDESSNSDLDNQLRWLVKLRSQGYAVLLVHHAGKNGDQRGASRRKDLLNTSIKLIEDAPTHGSGACFTITFDKIRGKKPEPPALRVELDTTTGLVGTWHTTASDGVVPAWENALRVIRDDKPETQKKLAQLLGVSQPAVSQHLKTARTKGLLHDDKLELTKKGMMLIEKHWPKETVDALG